MSWIWQCMLSPLTKLAKVIDNQTKYSISFARIVTNDIPAKTQMMKSILEWSKR